MTENEFDQFILRGIFGEQCGLVNQSHILLCSERDSLSALVELHRQRVGVFGLHPPGNPTSSILNGFRSWNAESNQAIVPDFGAYAKPSTFHVVMPQKVVDQTITHLAKNHEGMCVPFEATWYQLLGLLLPEIGWFYAAVSDEVPLSVFCTTENKQLTLVKTEFQARNIPFSSVTASPHGETVHFGRALRELCNLQDCLKQWERSETR